MACAPSTSTSAPASRLTFVNSATGSTSAGTDATWLYTHSRTCSRLACVQDFAGQGGDPTANGGVNSQRTRASS
eukprot:2694849-Pyramimonas_sp.AAC.1